MFKEKNIVEAIKSSYAITAIRMRTIVTEAEGLNKARRLITKESISNVPISQFHFKNYLVFSDYRIQPHCYKKYPVFVLQSGMVHFQHF